MTDDIVLETTIHEPSMTAGEVEMLLFALERSRAQFAWKCGGLDAAGVHQPFPPSTMTLAGLIKHLALCEDAKIAEFVTGEALGAPWDGVDGMSVWEWCWRSAADDTPEELYAPAQCRSSAPGRVGPSARRRRARSALGVHHQRWSVTEPAAHTRRPPRQYARHVGHADLFREAVDGLVGEGPPQP